MVAQGCGTTSAVALRYLAVALSYPTATPQLPHSYPTATPPLPLVPQLNFSIPADLLDRIDAAKPDFLDRKGFLCLLLTQALDKPGTLGAPSEAGAPSNTSSILLKEKNINNRINKARIISEALLQHTSLIEEFWRAKKGSKGDTAWKLLQTELGKLQASYGNAVVAEQLRLAINGKWAGVSASRYEQFKAPRGGLQQAPEQTRHPAWRVVRNGRFVDDDGPTTNPVLAGLF